MKRLFNWLGLVLVVVIGALGIAFAVANRQGVTVRFDPFAAKPSEEIAIVVPLFLALILALALGVLVGGLMTWFGQGKHRRALREARSEMIRLRGDVERLKS